MCFLIWIWTTSKRAVVPNGCVPGCDPCDSGGGGGGDWEEKRGGVPGVLSAVLRGSGCLSAVWIRLFASRNCLRWAGLVIPHLLSS